MNELELIKQNYDIKAQIISNTYTTPPVLLSACCRSKEEIEQDMQRSKEMAEKRCEKLQENEREKYKAIENYYKEREEKIQKMTDRELLEAIYRRLN